MKYLRYLLLFLGHLWALPHSLFGFLLCITVYWPKSIRFRSGAIEVVVYKDHLIPKGLDNFRTGGQTHGAFMFFADERCRDDVGLNSHERVHILQTMIFGGVLYPLLYGLSCLIGLLRGKSATMAYWDNWFERWARHE